MCAESSHRLILCCLTTAFSDMQSAHHLTVAALSSSIRSAVCQLKRTRLGKPKTGSIWLSSHCLVTGSAGRKLLS